MENWLEALEEAVVNHCVERTEEEFRRGGSPFAAMDCYLELRRRAKSGDVAWAEELVKQPPPEPAQQRVLEVLSNIIKDALDEYVDSCRESRGWARYICADFTMSYINKVRSELIEAAGEEAVRKAIAELDSLLKKSRIGA